MTKKIPNIGRLVVGAIRQLQSVQGSSLKEITNFLGQHCKLSGPDFKRAVQLTVRRGVNYGLIQRSKKGFVASDSNDLVEPVKMAECMDLGRQSARRGRRGRGKRRRGGRAKRRGGRSRRSRSRRRGRRHPTELKQHQQPQQHRRVSMGRQRLRLTGDGVPATKKLLKDERPPSRRSNRGSQQACDIPCLAAISSAKDVEHKADD